MGCLNLENCKHESRIIIMQKKNKNVNQEEKSNNVNNQIICVKAIKAIKTIEVIES